MEGLWNNRTKRICNLTNEIYKEWFGMTSKQYKLFKGLRKESLRDNMTDIEVARCGGKIAGNARKDLEY